MAVAGEAEPSPQHLRLRRAHLRRIEARDFGPRSEAVDNAVAAVRHPVCFFPPFPRRFLRMEELAGMAPTELPRAAHVSRARRPCQPHACEKRGRGSGAGLEAAARRRAPTRLTRPPPPPLPRRAVPRPRGRRELWGGRRRCRPRAGRPGRVHRRQRDCRVMRVPIRQRTGRSACG